MNKEQEELSFLYKTIFTSYKDVVNFKELIEMTGFKRNFLYSELKKGKFENAKKIGKDYRILKISVIKYLYQNN